MEGVMVSAFSGAMKSLLSKLATLLEKDYKLIKGVRKDITSLRDEMSSMNALLVKMSQMEELDVQEKEWRDKVRELAYDMEDCVDIFMHDAKGGQLKALWARYKIANLIKDLKDRAVEVRNLHDRYKIEERIVRPRVVVIDPRLPALYPEAASLVGIDGPKEELIELLTKEEGTRQLQVVPIVGFGGIGKTALASHVYTKVEGQFDCTASVSVSQNPNMVKVLTTILSGVLPKNNWYSTPNDERQLIDRLRLELAHKRYLIVIDDIWAIEAWNIIKCLFVENNNGSRIIVTTRIESVALACCSCFRGVLYKIKPLNILDSKRLFYRMVFHSEDACPEQLNKVSDEILKKCGGVPLAILSVASILASHEEVNSKEMWEKMQNYLDSPLETNNAQEWMRHVFNLGYNDLSVHVKTCMLYLGVFPEDSELLKDDLMRRWIAEGFVCETYTRGQEEVAEGYFNELINRSMIQIARLDDCGEVMSCRVHDLMLDFIISKCTEENFITVINDQHSNKSSLEVRRLSLQVRNSERNQMLGNMALTQARSFNFWGPAQGMPSLSNFRLLRVLHLDVYDSEGKQYDLSYIGRLFQLRYLRIRGIRSKKTQRQLQKLRHLKTLEIVEDQRDSILWLDVRELPLTLLHLIVPVTVELLGGIGRMSALRTLQLPLEDVEDIKGLGELADLRELKLHFNKPDAEETCILLSSLCKLGIGNLRSLTIVGPLHDDALSVWSPPPRNLRRLHILRCRFSIVPEWIGHLDMLSSLEVGVLSLTRDGAEVLARLPFLVHLRLHVTGDVPRGGVVICGAAFQNLKEFLFRYKVPCLTFEAGAMPRLQSLEIECNDRGAREDDGVLTGIEHLGSLKVFKVLIQLRVENVEFCSGNVSWSFVRGSETVSKPHLEELRKWDRKSLEAAFRKAINKHPRSPDFSIRYCNW